MFVLISEYLLHISVGFYSEAYDERGGIEEAKSDNKTYQCYHITFIFTSDGGKKTSDDMDAWISADTKRIPIRLEGKLPVGKIHCVYSGD